MPSELEADRVRLRLEQQRQARIVRRPSVPAAASCRKRVRWRFVCSSGRAKPGVSVGLVLRIPAFDIVKAVARPARGCYRELVLQLEVMLFRLRSIMQRRVEQIEPLAGVIAASLGPALRTPSPSSCWRATRHRANGIAAPSARSRAHRTIMRRVAGFDLICFAPRAPVEFLQRLESMEAAPCRAAAGCT